MFFFFILCAIIVLLIFSFAIYTSRVEIEIENLIINTEMPKGKKINEQSKIYVYLLFFKKIKLFKKNIKKMKKPSFKLESKDIDLKILKNNELKLNYKELLQNIEIDVKNVDLYVEVGTQDAALTAILVGAISAALGVALKKPKYKIVPIYSNKNSLKIKAECIISIYLMQYICILVKRTIGTKRTDPNHQIIGGFKYE